MATLNRVLRAQCELEAAWNDPEAPRKPEAEREEGDGGSTPAAGLRPTPTDLDLPADVRLLDVRPTESFCTQHIPGSASIPAEELPWRTPELPPKWRRFAVLADSAPLARKVAADLRRRGWRRAIHVTGAIAQWKGPWASGPARRFLWEPTPLVRAWGQRIPRGRALDLGCGSGRDAVYLAWQGHRVTAVDLLPDALEKAADLARHCGVELRLRQMDLRKQRPVIDRPYDLVCMIRFLDRDLLTWVPQALATGGHVLLEAYRHGGDGTAALEAGPGPRRHGLRLAPGEGLRLATDLGLVVTEYREDQDAAGAHIVSLTAQKP